MDNNNYHSLPYRPCVGMAIFNSERKVFLGERIDNPGAWQLPQGGINPGENIEQAVLRELQEEIGTTNVEILKIHDQVLRYDLPDYLIGKIWDGQYRGQEQTWVALRFLGSDQEINIFAHSSFEFKAWRWVDLTDILTKAVPFKRDTYMEVIRAFGEFASR